MTLEVLATVERLSRRSPPGQGGKVRSAQVVAVLYFFISGIYICIYIPIRSMYGIYANIWGILMVNVTIYGIHGSYGI